MNIVVCLKLAQDASDIEIRKDETISLERAEVVISSFDLQALEVGVRMREEVENAHVTVLTAGPKVIDHSRLRKDILSRGADELIMVADDNLQDADTALTARVLVTAIRKLERLDLVLFGEGSADLYFQQVGIQVGARLGLPTLNAISKIQRLGKRLRLERSLEDEIEVMEVTPPAALSVTTDITSPRLPTMKEILRAGKKPVTIWSLADLEGDLNVKRAMETLSTRSPHQAERKQIILEGTPREAALSLIGYLHKEGIL